jgi:hypothetical protein
MALPETKAGFTDDIPLGPEDVTDEILDAMWASDEAKLFNGAVRGPAGPTMAIRRGIDPELKPRSGNERPDLGNFYEDADLLAEIMK